MTNEELVSAIKAGDTGLMPELWEQIRRFVVMKARQYHFTCSDGIKCRTSVDDLTQSGYFALLKAIEYYKPTYPFISFLNMTLKTAFATEVGLRGASAAEVKNAPVSLYSALDDDEDSELIDVIEDVKARDPAEVAAESIYAQELHNALDRALSKTTELQEGTIRALYYFGLSKTELAAARKCSVANIDAIEKEALMKMRSGKYRGILRDFLYSDAVAPRRISEAICKRADKEENEMEKLLL